MACDTQNGPTVQRGRKRGGVATLSGMRSTALAVAMLLFVLTGCASASTKASTPAESTDPNAAACDQLDDLWAEVEAWGTTEGNTNEDGRPTATATSPNFRLQLDDIRQSTEGTLRTVLDEYFAEVPEDAAWWYANGTHEYGYTNAVLTACDSVR